MATKTTRRVVHPALLLGPLLAAGATLLSQMIRADVRAHTPAIVSTVAPFLTGDVVNASKSFGTTITIAGETAQIRR